MKKSIKLKADFKEQMKKEVRLSRKRGVSFNEILSTVKKHNPKGNQIEMLKKRWGLEVINDVIKEENTLDMVTSKKSTDKSLADTLLTWIKG